LLQAAGGSATGSDFSLGPDGDLELDYYDYDVHNTRAAPGSLLAMDPAYLLWIPPFTPGAWQVSALVLTRALVLCFPKTIQNGAVHMQELLREKILLTSRNLTIFDVRP